MIEINLVPKELKKKRKRASSSSGIGFVLPKEAMVGMVGGFFLLLVFVHIVLQVFISVKALKYKELKADLGDIAAKKVNADVVITELRAIQKKMNAIDEVAGGSRILWSQKLNEISDSMPRGVWLREIALIDDSLFLQGSAVSKDNTEILSAHKFTSNLKSNDNFKKYFSNIEIGIHKTHKINTISIADFNIDAELE